MAEKLIFSQAFEGLLRSLPPPVLTLELKDAMRARGFDPEGKLLPAYPVEIFVSVVQHVARTLHPKLSLDDAIAQVGRGFMDGFRQTLIGRAMVGMLGIIGPHTALSRINRQFRTANNYTETRLTKEGPNQYRLWVNEVTMAGWYVGIVSRGLEFSGVKSPKVELVAREGLGGTFLISWG